MDLEPMAMGMIHHSQFNIPQCPDSSLPLYRNFSTSEIETLKKIVSLSEWRERVTHHNVYYLVAFLQAKLNEGEGKVAHSLLEAIWTSSDSDRAFFLDKAVLWWADLAKDERDHDQQWVVANWLLADLNRQAGQFVAASSALQAFRAKMPVGIEPVTTAMMDYERKLIGDGDAESRKAPDRPRR